jgi:hypothetical protein
MCTQKEKKLFNNLNRLIIVCSGIVGLMLDGVSVGDVFCLISLLVWILQPECNAIEEKLLDKYKLKKVMPRRLNYHQSVK